jgi:4'-phosphopantetheinyl transferase EntD
MTGSDDLFSILAGMPHSDHDTIHADPVPAAAPTAFAGAWIARAAIGALDRPIERCAGFGSLHSLEVARSGDHSERRAREFVAGRAALRAALEAAGWAGDEPLLPGEQGRPGVPPGWTGSITHKDGLALAIARRLVDGRTLGIDSEVVGDRERTGIARKVLTPAELVRWEGDSSWPGLLEVFSTKESIYKALHPHVPRYIGFEEAELAADGAISMQLAGGEGLFRFASYLWWEGGGRLITMVEARR